MPIALLIAALAGSSSVSLPQAISAGNYFKFSDYPLEALRNNQQGSVTMRVVISPDGAPIRCEIAQSSAVPSLDTQSCTLMILRARFRPAHVDQGQNVFGVIYWAVHWSLPNQNRPPTEKLAEAYLTLNALPAGVSSPFIVTVGAAVDAAGKVTGCAPDLNTPEARAWQKATKSLGTFACDNLSRYWSLKALNDADGNPVRSVQSVRFSFAQDNAPPAKP